MKKKFFILTLLLISPMSAMAVDCSGGTNQNSCNAIDGCYWNANATLNQCRECESGYYCTGGNKTQCPNDTNNNSGRSDYGSDNVTQCYITCSAQSITDNNTTVGQLCYQSGSNNSCNGSTTNLYHDGSNYPSCYNTVQCSSGYALNPALDNYNITQLVNGINVSTNTFMNNINVCVQGALCNTLYDNTCAANQISGQITLSGGNWVYTNCSCVKQVSITNGTGTQTYKYNGSNWVPSGNPAVYDCNLGYCNRNNACISIPDNQYSLVAVGEDPDKCTRCPGGTFSDANSRQSVNSDGIRSCYVKGGVGGTKFCDRRGCFYLPTGVQVNHN